MADTLDIVARASGRNPAAQWRSWIGAAVLYRSLLAALCSHEYPSIQLDDALMLQARPAEKIRFGLVLALLAACFLMGGASRSDVLSLVILQPFVCLCATALLLVPGAWDWRSVREPLLLLGVLAAIIAAQLIPLPPASWTNLPGRSAFAPIAGAAGLPQPWRPISLSPDLTLTSLVGLIVPFAVLVGFAALGRHHRHLLLVALLAGVAVSALMGLAQVAGGPHSPFYTYKITNYGNAVGLFSNRNHQAVVLAMAWPLLVTYAMSHQRDRKQRLAVRLVTAGFAIFLLPLLLVTGSRAGLGLGLVGLIGAAAIWRLHPDRSKTAGRMERWVVPAIGVLGLLVLGATILLSKAEAIQRLLRLKAADDARLEATPTLLKMVRDFMPVGSGFGSFDPLFRYYEPFNMLDVKYLNHAHNDLIELAITAGLPGLALAAAFVFWWVARSYAAWRKKAATSGLVLGRAASLMILLTLLSSVVDYPLRTPLMMAIFALACAWLGAASGQRPPGTPARREPKSLYGKTNYT